MVLSAEPLGVDELQRLILLLNPDSDLLGHWHPRRLCDSLLFDLPIVPSGFRGRVIRGTWHVPGGSRHAWVDCAVLSASVGATLASRVGLGILSPVGTP